MIKGIALLSLLMVTALPARSADAMKPSPPATVSCTTAASSGDVYDVNCAIELSGSQNPKAVSFIEPPYEVVELLEALTDKDDENLWKIRLRFLLMGEVTLLFKVEYQSGSTVQIGTKYNPFVSTFKANPVRRGKVTTDSQGNAVREYESD